MCGVLCKLRFCNVLKFWDNMQRWRVYFPSFVVGGRHSKREQVNLQIIPIPPIVQLKQFSKQRTSPTDGSLKKHYINETQVLPTKPSQNFVHLTKNRQQIYFCARKISLGTLNLVVFLIGAGGRIPIWPSSHLTRSDGWAPQVIQWCTRSEFTASSFTPSLLGIGLYVPI